MSAITPKATHHANLPPLASRFVGVAALPWERGVHPGIETKTLLVDRASGLLTMLLRMAPGAKLPDHEHVLIEHRDVADCAVVGMEHARFGEVPRAIVQPAAGVVPGPRLTFELLKFLGGRLAPMKVPHRIDYAAELPRDANGKLRRALLSSVPK